MADKTVLRSTDGPVAWLRLNRPEAMNAINDSLISDLARALDDVAADPGVRVVVLTGNGRAFCAGGDLKAVAPNGELDPAHLMAFLRRGTATIERLPALTQPVIAAINGVAAAGGLEIAMACDIIVAAESARIGDAHANFGLLPGGGGAARLARIVGPMVAKRLAYTGALVPAADLVGCGLVSEVVPDDRLEIRVAELAAELAGKSPLVLARMKRLIDDSLDQSLTTGLRAELAALNAHAYSDDIREGLNAFRDKRTPKYAGR